MTTTTKKYVHIYTESVPNPNSLKFAVNFMLLPEGLDLDFATKEEAEQKSPLATLVFQQAGVERVFLMSNFITVTKEAEIDWLELIPNLKSQIKDYLEREQPILAQSTLTLLAEAAQKNQDTIPDSEVVSKIKKVLEEYVRPAVESDGGAISFKSFQEGIVSVELRGSCSGCPSSTITLKDGIQRLLTNMVPEVVGVVAEGV
jgi:Fe-S cluster biogenesis protein NfuA